MVDERLATCENRIIPDCLRACHLFICVVELIALMRIEQVQTFFIKKHYLAKQYSLAEVQLQLFDHFIHGLFTIDGHKLFNQYITTNTQKNGTQN